MEAISRFMFILYICRSRQLSFIVVDVDLIRYCCCCCYFVLLVVVVAVAAVSMATETPSFWKLSRESRAIHSFAGLFLLLIDANSVLLTLTHTHSNRLHFKQVKQQQQQKTHSHTHTLEKLTREQRRTKHC